MRRFVREQTEARLKIVDQRLREAGRSPENPEALHDLRVAIRRFTQCLRTFGSCFEKGAAKRIRRRLQPLMDQCGETRNCDVTLKLLRDCNLDRSDAARHVEKYREKSLNTLARHLKQWRARHAVRRWKSKLEVKAGKRGEWELTLQPSDNARNVLPALTEAFFLEGDRAAAAGTSHRTIHQFRLRVKRYRYTLEIFEPVCGRRVRGHLKTLRILQDVLGRINDCAQSLELIEGYRLPTLAITKLMAAREREFRSYWDAHLSKSRSKWVKDFEGPQAKKR